MSTPASAETVDLIIPELRVEEFDYELNENHDIYIVNDPFQQFVDESFKFSPASMDQIVFFEDSNDHGNQYEGVTQYLNNSLVSSDQNLEYTRNYYNLFTNETKSVGNIFLENGRTHLFTYDVSTENLTPMFFEFLFSQVSGGTTFDMDFAVVDPLGNTDIIGGLKTIKDVTQLIPFIPKTNGTHIFAITAFSNVVLAAMNINLEPEIVEVTSGYSEHFDGDITIGKFFFLDSENRSNIVEVSSIEFQKEYYIDENNIIKFGKSKGYNFGRETAGLLGSGNPLPNEDVYIAFIVSPSDPADVLVQKAKTDEVYDSGIDLELTLVSQKTPIFPLPLNVNFETDIIDSYSKDNGERIYQFETTETVLMGINSTINQNKELRFVSNDPDVAEITANPANYDVLNDINDDFVLLPAGVYTVYVPAEGTYRITLLEVTTFDIGQSLTLSPTFGDSYFFELPSGEYIHDSFNFTYLDNKNESVSFDYTIYDADGGSIDSDTVDFSNYYYDDSVDPNIIDLVLNLDNQTTILGDLNFRGGYLRLEIVANEKWNSSNGILLYSDETNITSLISIKRDNHLKLLQQLHPEDLYYFDTLGESINHNFLVGNDSIFNYINLVTNIDSVYRLTIDVTNRSIEEIIIDLGSNEWFNLDQLNPVNISNFNHYILTIEFLTTSSLFMGISLSLGNEDLNGTYTITLEEFTFEEFGVITLPGLNITDFSEIMAGGSILANPVFWAAIIGGAGIIAAIVIFLKRIGKI